jgi:hypothetical protein
MAKGGAGEARGIAAISALVGKQHKKKPVGKLKNIHEEREKSEKAVAKKAAAKNKEKKTKTETKAESKSDNSTSASTGSKTKSKQFKQREFNFNPPKPKSETPRKRPAAKKASGPNPTHSRNADTGKLEKMSPDVQKQVAAGIKSFDEKKASYSPPKMKPINLEE